MEEAKCFPPKVINIDRSDNQSLGIGPSKLFLEIYGSHKRNENVCFNFKTKQKKERSRGKKSVLKDTSFGVSIIHLLAATAKAVIFSK